MDSRLGASRAANPAQSLKRPLVSLLEQGFGTGLRQGEESPANLHRFTQLLGLSFSNCKKILLLLRGALETYSNFKSTCESSRSSVLQGYRVFFTNSPSKNNLKVVLYLLGTWLGFKCHFSPLHTEDKKIKL